MYAYSRLAMLVCAAACSLALLTGIAAANRALAFSPGGSITKSMSEFRIQSERAFVVACGHTTFGGSLTGAEIPKSAQGRLPEGRIGQITRAVAEECSEEGGLVAVRIPIGTGINLRYDAFLGTLPNITGIQFTKLTFSIELGLLGGLITCTYTGNPALLMTFPPTENGRGGLTNAESFVPSTLVLSRGTGCPGVAEIRGRGSVTPGQRLRLL